MAFIYEQINKERQNRKEKKQLYKKQAKALKVQQATNRLEKTGIFATEVSDVFNHIKFKYEDLSVVLTNELSDSNDPKSFLGIIEICRGYSYNGYPVNEDLKYEARKVVSSFITKFKKIPVSNDLRPLQRLRITTKTKIDEIICQHKSLNKDRLKQNLIKYIGCRCASLGHFGVNDLRVLQQCADVFKIERSVSEDQDTYIKRIVKSVQQIGESYKTEQPKRLKRAGNPITKLDTKLDIEDWNGYIKTPATSSVSGKQGVATAPVKTLDALVQELEQSIKEANRLRQEAAQKLSEAQAVDKEVNKLQEDINKRLNKSVNGKLVLIREEYEHQ